MGVRDICDTHQYFQSVKRLLDAIEPQVAPFVQALLQAYRDDRTLFLIGNGGSASNATHLAQDLNKGTLPSLDARKRFRAIALTDNVSFITALANDCGYDVVFEQQLRTLASPGDVLVAISGSGNSPNIVKAAEYANSIGMQTIGITGFSGGTLKSMSPLGIHVPSNDMGMVEAVHSVVFHLTMGALRKRLAEDDDKKPLKRAIFLDRDGVINVNRSDYVKNWDEFEFLPGALEGLRSLAQLEDVALVVVTNQSAIGRGIVSAGTAAEINERMKAAVSEAGGRLDAIYLCPHAPSENCDCRKPKAGLLHGAAADLGIRLDDSFMIGDRPSDVSAAVSAGCRPILLSPSGGISAEESGETWVAGDLTQAVERIRTSIRPQRVGA